MITALCSISNEYKLTCLLHGMYLILSLQMPMAKQRIYEHSGKITEIVLWNDINVWLLPNVQLVGNKYKIIFYNGSIFLILCFP